MQGEAPFIVLAVWGVVSGFSWIVWVIATNIRLAKVARTQGQMQAELVEKLGSSQELMGFLQTEAGFTTDSEIEFGGEVPEPEAEPDK